MRAREEQRADNAEQENRTMRGLTAWSLVVGTSSFLVGVAAVVVAIVVGV